MLQVQTISREVLSSLKESDDPSETTRRAPLQEEIIKAYLQGALHDASFNKGKRFRFAQKEREYLVMLKKFFNKLGINAWIYKEGKHRDVYILETLAKFLDFDCNPLGLLTQKEKIAYVRGFFDAEGGIPKQENAKFYIQLVQKDLEKIQSLKLILNELDITTGKIHNPSVRVDPEYWRCFVSTKSHRDFASIIGSWHPRKKAIFSQRMKI